MLRAKRLAAVVVVSILMAVLLPADVVAASGLDGVPAAPEAPAVQADIAPPSSGSDQALADDVDPQAVLARELSVPDPVAHLPGRAKDTGSDIAAPLNATNLAPAAVFGDASREPHRPPRRPVPT
jgi:hypothetical protein